jgi:aminopeptidase N
MDTLDVGGQLPQVAVTKTSPPEADPQRTHALSVGTVNSSGVVRAVAEVLLTDADVPVRVDADAVLVVPDFLDATWAKIRFGADGWSRVAAVLPLIADDQPAVVIYNAIRDAVRDATLAPTVALDVLCAGLATASSDLILASLGIFTQDQLAGAYSPVSDRPERLARIHGVARQQLAGSVAGSDHQLTTFRLAVRSATDLDLLRRWYRGDQLPPGFDLDQELAWDLIERMATLVEDHDLVAEALARDPSASAHVHAARARAAWPSGEAKEAAWALLMHPTTASPYELYATAEGFFQPNQAPVTEPFVRRYFAEIAHTAQFRTGWTLGELASRSYPWTFPTSDAVELADRALAGELATPLRRSLVDGTDRLRRAARSLATFLPHDPG